ncbi:MAG: hypothetical protein P4M14_08040 [Gammaproteobacteria bacterium]|nr:hypothetical protein [Gammaproteobacteria bacterium]
MSTLISQLLADTLVSNDDEEAKAVNLPTALTNGDYVSLLENLRVVLRTVGFCRYSAQSDLSSERYQEICHLNRARLDFVIGKEIYTVLLDNKLDKKFVHDVVFHFCQSNAEAAGKLLNKNIWKFWHSDISDLFIKYGADVNAKPSSTAKSTLFQAIRSSNPIYVIRHLIEKGASYQDCEQEVAGQKYPLMLVAALQCVPEVLAVLGEKFPREIEATLQLLNGMLSIYEENKFSLNFGDYQAKPITRDDLLKAEQSLLQMQLRQSVYAGRSIFNNGFHPERLRLVTAEEKVSLSEAKPKFG